MVRIIPSILKHSSTTPSRNPSPTRHKDIMDTGLVLKVLVMRAENLAAKDRSGTSDPYLVLILGDTKCSTHSVDKTLNPEWNVQFHMPVVGAQSLLLNVIAWDKDKFGKDYLGEFDLALEDIFSNGSCDQEPRWFSLSSKRTGKKDGNVSGQVLLQFSLLDTSSKDATEQQVFDKLFAICGIEGFATPATEPGNPMTGAPTPSDDYYGDVDETLIGARPMETTETHKRRLKLMSLKKQRREHGFEFNAGSDVVGVVYLEILNITDLPPERNMTRTGFDMDAFVVATLGKKTFRTKRIRHNLNPVYREKMLFQILNNEQTYSFGFSVMDHDKYSGNDFIASAMLPLQLLLESAPTADPVTGLYNVDISQYVPSQRSKRRIGLKSSSSNLSLKASNRLTWRGTGGSSTSTLDSNVQTSTSGIAGASFPVGSAGAAGGENNDQDPWFRTYTVPLKMTDDKWEASHSPVLYVRAKYQPYPALRQQFWRAMLRQFDADESGHISKVELSTMLDTLGSTLKESTIDGLFQRYSQAGSNQDSYRDMTIDEAVICLEDELQKSRSGGGVASGGRRERITSKIKGIMNPDKESEAVLTGEGSAANDDDDNSEEEHVVEIQACPICHQPRLNKRKDADIITHIATCASQDWRQVNDFMMGGFVTASQAQRKWYSKVITKIGYGGYKLGANSANILVQDRITGQIIEEKMSVYVRLGIRLLYKGLRSNNMENKRIRKLLKNLSIKQGRKYDDPATKAEIPKFIQFHRLDMSEVLLPVEKFGNFNEFFYRQLKPNARPCTAPENAHIITSPADCRSVVFNTIDKSTNIWIKGRDFSLKRLLEPGYPQDVNRFEGGSLGIFRLAPQDYHRFHIPVDGIMGKPFLVEGEYYTVNPMAIRSALDVFGENVRVLVPIDSPTHGRVMVICVGAMMVGSTVITRHEGEQVKRAEELGYFKFGGSTIILLFEKGRMVFDEDLVANSEMALETLIRAGMSIGHSPNVPQWLPDKPKDQADITEADKQLAKLRIHGSTTDDWPNDSSSDEPGGLAMKSGGQSQGYPTTSPNYAGGTN